MTWTEHLQAIDATLQPAAARRQPWCGIPQVVDETPLSLSLVLTQPLPAGVLPGPLQLGLNQGLPPLLEELATWPGSWELLFCQPSAAEAGLAADLSHQRDWQQGALRHIPGLTPDTLWQQAPALAAGTWLLRLGIEDSLSDALADRSRLINRQRLWTPEHTAPPFAPPVPVSEPQQLQQRRRHLLVVSTGAARSPDAIPRQDRIRLEAWRQAGFRLLLLPGRASRRQLRTCLRRHAQAPAIAWVSWLPSGSVISCAGLDQLRSAAPARPLLIDRRRSTTLSRWHRPRPRAGLTQPFPFQRRWRHALGLKAQTLDHVILGWPGSRPDSIKAPNSAPTSRSEP